MLTIMFRFLVCCVLVSQVSCKEEGFEAKFLHNERDRIIRVEKMEKYPLEQQYKIFLYGNQKMHPPHKGLARPIARRGKPALDYVLEQIRDSENDLDFRDSIIIFKDMQQQGYYDVCKDALAMDEIKSNETKIRYDGWLKFYREALYELCPR